MVATRPEPPPTVAGDRTFRPDVEGLRAIAVLLVVLFHAGMPGIRGGYVGVDVFFVLSGFLITGLLLRERIERGTTSMTGFYARRARRILPMASIVLVLTVLAAYHYLGFIRANRAAIDGRWASFFAANIHFAREGTNYFTAQAPPSPLQHYWSLAVEEQFYLVWPLLFMVVAIVGRRTAIRARVAPVLAAVVVASFVWCVVQTNGNGTWAYFSPLTRAWELALGALVAVGVPFLKKQPRIAGIALSCAGVTAIVASAFLFNTRTAFPGSAAALPVVGAAAAVAGGTIAPGGGAEPILRLRPLQWIGLLSYSWYLWHWPVLIIDTQRRGHDPSLARGLVLVGLALVLSAVGYYLVENRARYARALMRRPQLSIAFGLCLVLLSWGVCTREYRMHHHVHRTVAEARP